VGLVKIGLLKNDNFFIVVNWLVAGLGLSLATQLLVTSLIALKIWWAIRRNSVYLGASPHMAVVWTILDSGAVYSLTVVFMVAFIAMKTQVGGLISNIFLQCVSFSITQHLAQFEGY
jgi:hypothetical protein